MTEVADCVASGTVMRTDELFTVIDCRAEIEMAALVAAVPVLVVIVPVIVPAA